MTATPLQDGGYVFSVKLKRPLILSVGIRLFFTDVGGEETAIVPNNTFYNNSPITLVVPDDQVPYEVFTLGVQLFYGVLEGPVHQPNTTYSELTQS